MERGDSDSDAPPEELTFDQGIKKDAEITELKRDSKARVAREKKESRRLWVQRKSQKEPRTKVPERLAKDDEDEGNVPGMLPRDIISFLASREKKVFSSDSDSDNEAVGQNPVSRKKKQKKSRTNAVLLKDAPPPQCAKNSLDFLKKRKAQVPRSRAILKNADQALRLMVSRGDLISNR